MVYLLQQLSQLVWGIPALTAILGVGGFLTIRTGFAQLRLLPNGLCIFKKRLTQNNSEKDGISPYQAFCTAMGATVGTGNIAGVAGAIAIGGPGAVFWMWVSAFFGMIIKYAEALLAVRYQEIGTGDQMHAGPMYIINKGMGTHWRSMAYIYALLGLLASFGVGNSVQINTAISSIQSVLQTFGESMSRAWTLILGICAGLLVYILLIGGAGKIAHTAEKLVPVAALAYILLCVGVLVARWQQIDDAFKMIFIGAFSPKAVTGGALGTLLRTIRIGTSRGVFTNEAGLGTAGMAHGSTKVEHPAMQGVLGIVEVFLDTIVICTLTALVILCSGVPVEYGCDIGAELTIQGFIYVFGKWTAIALSIITICLAVATVLGWGFYGAQCAKFLFGEQSWKGFVILHGIAAFCGAVLQAPTVWLLSEVLNGLMLLPNLIAVLHRSEIVVSLTKNYQQRIKLERKFRHCQGTDLW